MNTILIILECSCSVTCFKSHKEICSAEAKTKIEEIPTVVNELQKEWKEEEIIEKDEHENIVENEGAYDEENVEEEEQEGRGVKRLREEEEEAYSDEGLLPPFY